MVTVLPVPGGPKMTYGPRPHAPPSRLPTACRCCWFSFTLIGTNESAQSSSGPPPLVSNSPLGLVGFVAGGGDHFWRSACGTFSRFRGATDGRGESREQTQGRRGKGASAALARARCIRCGEGRKPRSEPGLGPGTMQIGRNEGCHQLSQDKSAEGRNSTSGS